VENTEVITQHSKPLTSQISQRKLAGFMARLGILDIEGETKRAAFLGRPFSFPRGRSSTSTGYRLSILDSNARTDPTLESDQYPSGRLLTRSATQISKTNGMKYVSIEKAPRAQEKINAFRNRNENREGKKIRTKTRKSIVARGSKLPAPSSQLPAP
jgi:hypothetical protein